MSHCSLVPSYSGFARETARSQAEGRGLVIRLALANYREDRGRYPEQIADLVPTYLGRLWVDPFDGRPLRYRNLGDGYQLYSIGVDFDDDQGRPQANRDVPREVDRVLDCLGTVPDPHAEAELRKRLKAEMDRGENPSVYDGVDGDILLGRPPR